MGNYKWYSVETPSVFREYRLPADGPRTEEEEKHLTELEDLAERYDTYITVTSYPRG